MTVHFGLKTQYQVENRYNRGGEVTFDEKRFQQFADTVLRPLALLHPGDDLEVTFREAEASDFDSPAFRASQVAHGMKSPTPDVTSNWLTQVVCWRDGKHTHCTVRPFNRFNLPGHPNMEAKIHQGDRDHHRHLERFARDVVAQVLQTVAPGFPDITGT